MDCNKTDCIHYKVCEEWKSLGNDNYINESNGNCDCYSSPYNPSGDCISREALKAKMKEADAEAIDYEMLVGMYEKLVNDAQAVDRPQSEREFIELEVKYLPDDITPTDYRGKPYYSIHYKENGEEFVGFGTYKPEVLSKYLKENFMQGGAS